MVDNKMQTQGTDNENKVQVATNQKVFLSKQAKVRKELLFLIIVLAIIELVFGVYFGTRNTQQKNNISQSTARSELISYTPASVSITKSGFVPATVTIKAGQGVDWTNTDTAPHVIASDPYPSDN